MNEQEILKTIIRHAREVLPALQDRPIRGDDSLRALGANSIDRSEIVMMTLGSLSLNVPLIELARAENIGELTSILHGKFQVA
jgi:polyketide biosynthesis acyl carrier protein